MKKKVLAAVLCAAMAGSMLAGCGGKSDGDKKETGKREMEVEGDNVTTLNVWTFIENHQDFYTEMAEKWNEENPDKKVKLVLSNMAYDDMHNKLSLALESGEGAPDVVDIELGKFPAFTTGQIGLMDLTDAIEPYKDKVVESRLDLYAKDGKYYGFPTHVGTTLLSTIQKNWKQQVLTIQLSKPGKILKMQVSNTKKLQEKPLQRQRQPHSGL